MNPTKCAAVATDSVTILAVVPSPGKSSVSASWLELAQDGASEQEMYLTPSGSAKAGATRHNRAVGAIIGVHVCGLPFSMAEQRFTVLASRTGVPVRGHDRVRFGAMMAASRRRLRRLDVVGVRRSGRSSKMAVRNLG